MVGLSFSGYASGELYNNLDHLYTTHLVNNSRIKNNKMNKNIKINMIKNYNNIYRDIRRYSTYTKMTLEKAENLDFNFSAFYEKQKIYLPNIKSPSSNFLS
jgi:hypothetical protein